MRYLLVIIFTIKVIKCNEVVSTTLSVKDRCIDICKNAELPDLELVPSLSLIFQEDYKQILCQRGCSFFKIFKFKDEFNVNTTTKECYVSCEDSYVFKKENEICKNGCDLSAIKLKEKPIFLVFTEKGEENNVLTEPDLEILDSDLLSDPSIKSQLEIGFNVDYKIPETHVRTMPISIQETIQEIKIKDGDWLDCASRNSGIPRWILLSAILSVVLIALWLSFSAEKQSREEELVDVDVPDDKCILTEDFVIEKDATFPEDKSPCFNEVGFSGPPKYSVETEKI